MGSKWSRSIGYSLLAVLLLNVFHAFFLYQKEYKPITVQYTVSSNFETFTWFVYTPKHSEDQLRTKSVQVLSGIPKTITTEIDTPNGLQFLGCYYSWSDRGTFGISDIQISAGDTTWYFDDLNKLIAYSSENITPTINNESVSATSTRDANGWLMLDVLEFEKLGRTKKFTPLHWAISLGLLLVFILFGKIYTEKIRTFVTELKIEGPFIYKARMYLLYLWMVLLPFWLIISHVLMAVSVALAIVHFVTKRSDFNLKPFRKFIPLFVLFFAITLVNLVAHSTRFGTEFGDYIYFILAPFVFVGITKKELSACMEVFKITVFSYLILLSIAIVSRYFQLTTTYNFGDFFFETVEQYWHSSYLAGFVIAALLFQYARKRPTWGMFVFTAFAFVFIYFSQARLPLLLGLVLLSVLTVLKFPKKIRTYYISIGAVLLVGGIIWVSQSQALQENIKNTLFTNEVQKLDARPALWQQAIAIGKENWATGIGLHNIRTALANRIDVDSQIKYRRYNAHNQYLEFLLGYGVLVVVLFLIVLGTPLAVRYPKATLFALYMCVAMLVESYLSRQSGVVLFSVWYSFFIWYDSKNSEYR
ncbi:MAG: hypothetical protein CMC13_03260 [Flavobacteriaceae bacterium]|nr:hypothetical protein [Flavobacteriaceae bacterium]|tara:strand:- start:2805 stop:4568 length:1764 start_codon:yes stop_codon:yes gene_type:complete